MKTNIALALLLAPHLLFAQALVSMSASNSHPPVGDEVEFVIDLAGQGSPWCGLEINFGDGEFREVRVDANPLKVKKLYRVPGNYAVRAQGSFVRRGLRSTFACQGGPQTVLVDVVDPAVALRAKRELEDKQQALARRERDVQEREQQIAAQQRREREEAAAKATVAAGAAKAAKAGHDAGAPNPAPKPATAPSAPLRKDDSLRIFGIGAAGH